MKILIEDKIYEVIYIEYNGNIPDSVITKEYIPNAKNGPYWRPTQWDLYLNKGYLDDLRAYESGSGGTADEIHAPQIIDGFKGAKYWKAEGVEFDGTPKNIKKLKYPILLKGDPNSRNPFKIAEITYDQNYCDVCGHYSTDYCEEHIYFDDEGDARYYHDNSMVN